MNVKTTNVKKRDRDVAAVLALCSVLIVSASMAYAGGTELPWEGPLDTLMRSISGPVVRTLGVIAIVASGLTLASGEGGGGMRKMLWIVFGLSIAIAATSLLTGFLGFADGLSL